MLVIQDLALNKEMTKDAMAAVFGGGHGYGNYDHTHSGPWAVRGYSQFYKKVYKHGKKYLALQRRWTLVRRQVRHIGRCYILRRYS